MPDGAVLDGTPPPGRGPAGDATHVRTVRRLDQHAGRAYDRVWQPYVAEWAPAAGGREAHLAVVYGGHLAGKVDMGDIWCCVSTDGGDAWSEPVAVFDHTLPLGPLRFAYANPILFKPPGQPILWCFAMRCPLLQRDSENSALCAAYSVDGGRSWQPVELAVHWQSSLIVVAGIATVPDAAGHPRYLLPAHRNSLRHDVRGHRDHAVLESANLLEWRLAGYVPQAGLGGEPGTPTVFLHEGSIAGGDAPGELKMVMRTADYHTYTALEPPVAYSTVSTDGGRTWSLARPEPALHNAVSKAFFGRDARGRHVYVYSAGPRGERRALHYTVKRPGGAWGAPRAFYAPGVKNSYPTLIEYAPGRFHCVWDSSDSPDRHRTVIRYGRLDLGDL
ncbi:MAG TPA: sialidase family protein [Chloroflexota bacterium]|nr:sialidase family protein [Chloroflexota bacterium]